jgi:branched-chain amino acid transport system ATP-binding protein
VRRGTLPILEHVGFSLSPGRIAAMVGPNGTGKTSLLETLAGLLPAAHGTIELDGRRIDTLPVHRRASLGVRLVRDRGLLFPSLTVEENLAMAGAVSAKDWQPYADAFPVVAARLGQKAALLSGGEKRILALVIALLARPRLLLADEFTEGLQAGVVPRMLACLRTACADGMMALLVVHSPDLVEREALTMLELGNRALVQRG